MPETWEFEPLIDSPEQLLLVYFVVWTALTVLAKGFFGRAGHAERKRRAWVPFNLASGLLLVGFVWALGFPGIAVGSTAAAVAAIIMYSVRMAWFCDSCGGLALHRLGQNRQQNCSRCGTRNCH